MNQIDPIRIIETLVILFFGVGIHEYAHCKFADLAGDPTPAYYGRVTLNLFKHFEPSGTLMMVCSSILGYGIGWGRAAPIDPRKMNNPRWDCFISVLAGPLSNLGQAILFGCAFRGLYSGHDVDLSGSDQIANFLVLAIQINLTLMLFNLIPFGPLDGHWLFGLLLPEIPRNNWFRFNRSIGMPGLFVAVILLQVTKVNFLTWPIIKLMGILIGRPLDF